MDSRLLGALALAAALAVPLRASAEPPAPAAAPAADQDDDGPADTGSRHSDHPLATDMRTGNVYLVGKYGLTAPAGELGPVPEGSFGTSRAAADITGTGMSFGGILGVGIHRYVSLEASGAYSMFGAPTGCDSRCNGHSYDLGLGLAYHLAQGIAVDPWGSFGMGYRVLTFKTNVGLAGTVTDPPSPKDNSQDQHYRGFDFARIALGADFYPAPFFGFGPYVAVDVGASLNPPLPKGAPPPTGISTYAFIHFGIRIAFDPFRSATSSSRVREIQAQR